MARVVAVLLLLMAVVSAVAWYKRPAPNGGELALYGNVEIRQVNLGFNVEGRLASMLLEEGDQVRQGQAIARMDTGYLQDAVSIADGRVAAAEAQLAMLRTGSRPQEIEQARAAVKSAEAAYQDAERHFGRELALFKQGVAGTRAGVDSATAARDRAQAALASVREQLDLAQVGPRDEQIKAAEAQLQAERGLQSLMQRRLRDAELFAPADGTLLSRVHEPGEVLAPGATVYTLALKSPLWVRAFVGEAQLGRVRAGQQVEVSCDSAPGTRFKGQVGFISPTAEFTPKTVETPELRTDLVYRLRVVMAPGSEEVLRQGMPVTVHVPATR